MSEPDNDFPPYEAYTNHEGRTMTPEEHQTIVNARSDPMYAIIKRETALRKLTEAIVTLRDTIRDPALPAKFDDLGIDSVAGRLLDAIGPLLKATQLLVSIAVWRRDLAINERDKAAGAEPRMAGMNNQERTLDEGLMRFAKGD